MSDTPEAQAARRALRRQLGLCWHCLDKPVPGRTACQFHLDRNARANTKWMQKRNKARGWVMKRVKV